MGILSGFGFGGSEVTPSNELPELFPLGLNSEKFIEIDVVNIYTSILIDVLQRTHGIPEEQKTVLWDNCLGNENSKGLVTLLAEAMYSEKDLFIVYRKDLKAIKVASIKEESLIRADYKISGESKHGIFVSFTNYRLSQILKIYSALEYCTVAGLNKSLNLALAVFFKYGDLRESIGAIDSSGPHKQATAIFEAIKAGKGAMLDAKDIIEMLKPDLQAVEASMSFINQKRSFYLKLPASYVTGIQPSSLSDTGQADQKAVERGLLIFYFAVIKPVVDKLFDKKTSFKSDDSVALSTGLEVLRTMEGTSEELVSMDNKLLLVNKALGLPENAKGDPVPTLPPAAPPSEPPSETTEV